jgi:hypothetical protein
MNGNRIVFGGVTTGIIILGANMLLPDYVANHIAVRLLTQRKPPGFGVQPNLKTKRSHTVIVWCYVV